MSEPSANNRKLTSRHKSCIYTDFFVVHSVRCNHHCLTHSTYRIGTDRTRHVLQLYGRHIRRQNKSTLRRSCSSDDATVCSTPDLVSRFPAVPCEVFKPHQESALSRSKQNMRRQRQIVRTSNRHRWDECESIYIANTMSRP